jgi:hypothetical protein
MNNDLEKLIKTGICPVCNGRDIDGVTHLSKNEVWFDCPSCAWGCTCNLDKANEMGYYLLWDVVVEGTLDEL